MIGASEYLRLTAKSFVCDAEWFDAQDPDDGHNPAVWATCYRAVAQHLRSAAEMIETDQ